MDGAAFASLLKDSDGAVRYTKVAGQIVKLGR